MALTEKKIEIIEMYLSSGGNNGSAAVKTIDPAIKNPNVYAYKLFQEREVKEYLSRRRREILLKSGLDLEIVMKSLTKNLYSSLGLVERTVLAHGKDGFNTITGKYEDSGDVKNYWGVLRDILGPEISAIIASEEIKEDKAHEIKLKNLDLAKKNITINQEKNEILRERNKIEKDSSGKGIEDMALEEVNNYTKKYGGHLEG